MKNAIYSKLCEKVGIRYHKRIAEILKVLDCSVEYNLRYIRNASVFREAISNYQNNKDGYERISGSFTTLHGSFRDGNEIVLDSPFIVCLVKERLMKPNQKETFVKNTLLIYEKVDSNIASLVRGVS